MDLDLGLFVCVWLVGLFASFAALREMVFAFGFSTSPANDLAFPSASPRLCGRMVLTSPVVGSFAALRECASSS
jgi:hypothetical protein